jgi:hypothetical protein
MLLALHMRTVQNRLAGKATLDFCEGMSGASMITLHLLKRGFNGRRFDTKLDPRHDVCTGQGLRVWLFERSHLRKGGTRASLFNTVGRGTLDIKFPWRRWPGIGSVRVRLARAHRRGPRCFLEGGAVPTKTHMGSDTNGGDTGVSGAVGGEALFGHVSWGVAWPCFLAVLLWACFQLLTLRKCYRGVAW